LVISESANSTDSALGTAGFSKENNIFRALMQKIKTLEMNSAIVELFTIQVKISLFAYLFLLNSISS
jgi:hypothetical protein